SAEKGTRGRVMGLYTSILGITFAVGPLIIPLTGIDGWLPWLIGIFCVGLSALPLAFVKVSEDAFRNEGAGFLSFIGRAPLILILGTSAFAIYTVALTILGERFEGSDLIAGSAAFAAMWGVGGIIGPPIAGTALDAFGLDAIPLTLAAFYVVFLLGLAFTGG